MEAGGPPVPPVNPGGQAAPVYQGGDPLGAQPPATRPSGLWWGLAALIAVIVGVAGYFLGSNHEADNYKAGSSGYQTIYQTGYTAGQQAGAAAGTVVGKKAGARYGKKVGYAKGNSAGKAAGEVQGTADGANAALGGLSSWDTGTHYIVTTIDPTLAGVPAAINTRTAMAKNITYALCQSNPNVICAKPEK